MRITIFRKHSHPQHPLQHQKPLRQYGEFLPCLLHSSCSTLSSPLRVNVNPWCWIASISLSHIACVYMGLQSKVGLNAPPLIWFCLAFLLLLVLASVPQSPPRDVHLIENAWKWMSLFARWLILSSALVNFFPYGAPLLNYKTNVRTTFGAHVRILVWIHSCQTHDYLYV